MDFIDYSNKKSRRRGYEYFKQKKVLAWELLDEHKYMGVVAGSGTSSYFVIIDLAHPRRSECNCPHAKGRQIICKHKMALYFTIFPDKAQEYIDAMHLEEEKEAEREINDLIDMALKKMKKSELAAELTSILLMGPDWQLQKFLDEHLEGWDEESDW
jgi:alcohol dehydrogenase class IV